MTSSESIVCLSLSRLTFVIELPRQVPTAFAARPLRPPHVHPTEDGRAEPEKTRRLGRYRARRGVL